MDEHEWLPISSRHTEPICGLAGDTDGR